MSRPTPTHDLARLDFLPGRFRFADGCLADYKRLAVFHYKGPTLGVSRVFRKVVYHDEHTGPRTAAIAVACMPTLRQRHREAFFGIGDLSVKQIGGFVNEHLLVISRVILHPQFRGMGLSTLLIRDLIRKCPKRYVEASAVMGRFIPMFERAGMVRLSPLEAPGPAYFLRDKRYPKKPRRPGEST
ncbi:MAG: hypothetical protein AAGD32_16625 [Planctomycetota bacterium]